MRALQQNRAQSRFLYFLSNVSICWMRLPEVNVELFCGISANFIFKSQRQADESVQGETPARGFFFFNRAPLLTQARFLHARLALSSRSPHAFLCSPVKHKIMANVPQFAVLDKATG